MGIRDIMYSWSCCLGFRANNPMADDANNQVTVSDSTGDVLIARHPQFGGSAPATP